MLFDKEDLSKIKKNRSQDCHVVSKDADSIWLGLHEDVRKGRVYPAALVLGLLKPNCIVTWSLGSDRVWFCVLQNGRPLVGLDRVLDGNQALAYKEKYRVLFPAYEMVNTQEGLEHELGALLKPGLQERHLQTIGSKDLGSLLMESPAQSRKLRFKICGVVACVLSLAMLSFEYVGEQLSLKEHARAAFENTLRAALLHEEDLKSKVEQEKAAEFSAQDLQRQRQAYLLFADPAQLWSAFNAIRHVLPISSNGIRASALRCEIHACVVDWVLSGALKGALANAMSTTNKNPFGLPFLLDRGLNAQGESLSTLAIDLQKKTYRFPELLNPEQLELYMTLDVKKRWPNLAMTPLRASFTEKPQSSKGQGTKAPGGLEPDSNPPTTMLNKQGALKADQILVHQGQWEMSFVGDGALFEAERFLNALRNHPVQLQAVAYTYRQGLKLKGRYYFLPPLTSLVPEGVDLKSKELGINP
jgi:hypothetical protein